MGMNLGVKKTTYGPNENQEWLGSSQGTQSMDSITLENSSLILLFTTGIVPSGIPLIRTAGGLYRAAITAEVPEYHLFTTVDLTAGGAVPAGADTPASGLWHGEIVAAKVPTYTDKTSSGAAHTTVGQFKYV